MHAQIIEECKYSFKGTIVKLLSDLWGRPILNGTLNLYLIK